MSLLLGGQTAVVPNVVNDLSIVFGAQSIAAVATSIPTGGRLQIVGGGTDGGSAHRLLLLRITGEVGLVESRLSDA